MSKYSERVGAAVQGDHERRTGAVGSAPCWCGRCNARPSAEVWVNGVDIVVLSGWVVAGTGQAVRAVAHARGDGEGGVEVAVLGAEGEDARTAVLGREVGVAGDDQEVEVRVVLAEAHEVDGRRTGGLAGSRR